MNYIEISMVVTLASAICVIIAWMSYKKRNTEFGLKDDLKPKFPLFRCRICGDSNGIYNLWSTSRVIDKNKLLRVLSKIAVTDGVFICRCCCKKHKLWK